MDPRLSYCCYLHGCLCVLVLLLCSWRAADAQAQQPPPHTDPTEAAALNAMMARLGLSAPPSWNISSDPCSGAATDDTPLDDNPAFNPAIKCDCSDHNNTLCHITRLYENQHAGCGRPDPRRAQEPHSPHQAGLQEELFHRAITSVHRRTDCSQVH
nr:probable LRR receptor-like serine/threonine-protein kinase At1g56140 [Oryza sativa Japonica Group]